MTYAQFVEIINMPSVMVIIFCVVYVAGLGIMVLVNKIRR